jgi:hypothetical protein
MLDPAWKTAEPADALWFERAVNAGSYMAAIAFGALCVE